MARDKESMQDIALHHMDKLNRRNQTENKPKTLAEQLKESQLSPEERRKRMPAVEWHRDLAELVFMGKGTAPVSKRLFEYVRAKYKKEIEDFRLSGAPLKDVMSFIRSKSDEYINM